MKEQLDKVERELIEQEHRPIKLIANFIDRKEKWPNDKGKQRSAVKAILWRLFFSPAVIAITGGGIAICSLIVLICQNDILISQNKLIKDQNEFFRKQILGDDIREARRNLYSLDPTTDKSSSFITESLFDYIEYSRLLDPSDSIKILTLTGLNLSKSDLSNQELRYLDFQGTFLPPIIKNTDFTGTTIRPFILNRKEVPNHKIPNILFENCEMVDVKLVGKSNYQRIVVFYKSNLDNMTVPQPVKHFYPGVVLFYDCYNTTAVEKKGHRILKLDSLKTRAVELYESIIKSDEFYHLEIEYYKELILEENGDASIFAQLISPADYLIMIIDNGYLNDKIGINYADFKITKRLVNYVENDFFNRDSVLRDKRLSFELGDKQPRVIDSLISMGFLKPFREFSDMIK
ncbi:pentapeptide repeat-containing protein [Muricauda sp. NFXS6]|uniref:hypothetical protein n=1 Tax=Allomuricauda sp. NFXS6 TaxID=2819094 RepID=UPI0032DFE857